MNDDDLRARRAAYTDAELYRIVAGQHLLDGYARDKAEFDDLVAALPESGIVSYCAKDAYSDADRYRIMVEHAMRIGRVETREEWNILVRSLGDIEAFDAFIAFRNQRPGCIASERTEEFSCACGRRWRKDDPAPPPCDFARLAADSSL